MWITINQHYLPILQGNTSWERVNFKIVLTYKVSVFQTSRFLHIYKDIISIISSFTWTSEVDAKWLYLGFQNACSILAPPLHVSVLNSFMLTYARICTLTVEHTHSLIRTRQPKRCVYHTHSLIHTRQLKH